MTASQTFAQIYRQHAPAVFGLALLLCGNRSDAEDLTSEAFARAFASGGAIAQASARSYLYAIVRTLVASQRRRPAVEVAGVDEAEICEFRVLPSDWPRLARPIRAPVPLP